jgi:NADPH:quinone reductase-like Zn-dependent oxidoreductase
LHAPKQRYQLGHTFHIPQANEAEEVLIKIEYIGLNPIDWKAPDFGFGIPSLPYIAGREFVGQIVSEPATTKDTSLRTFRRGDVVFSASTDYRDRRKAAFQQYTIAPIYNLSRVPVAVADKSTVAGLGVAFVAAALTLGVCLGCDFSRVRAGVPAGPDLKNILRHVPTEQIPVDVRAEALEGITDEGRPAAGDWLTIWGGKCLQHRGEATPTANTRLGSSATAYITAQLAKHFDLRVLKVVDIAKHGEQLSQGPADLIVDSHDPDRAVSIIRRVTNHNLRFGVDTVGKPTAELLRKALRSGGCGYKSHLVGLTGLPKVPILGVEQHTVPIKLHHEIPWVGEALMVWLEKLLASGKIRPPEVEVVQGGLNAVNGGLDRMRRGDISGRRLAVSLE